MDLLRSEVKLDVELTFNFVVCLLEVFFFDGEEELVSSVGVWCLRNDGPLSLRVGVSNDFRSKPLPTQVKTDTAYFLRTTYVWK